MAQYILYMGYRSPKLPNNSYNTIVDRIQTEKHTKTHEIVDSPFVLDQNFLEATQKGSSFVPDPNINELILT